MSIARVLGADLYYEQHGQGPPLLFAHGLAGNHIVWWQQVPFFRERFTCITFDQPGFGWSAEPAGEAWSYVDCLEGLIEALGLERVCLVGQSMGGRTCLGYALRQPERVAALVMTSTIGSLQLPERGDWQSSVRQRRAELAARGINPACGETMAREQPALHFLYQQLAAQNARWSAERLPPGSVRVPAVTRQDLRGFTVPTLFVIGEQDVIVPAAVQEAAAAAVPNARVVRFPAAGHSVYFEHAAAWNRAVDGFLAEALG